MSFLLAETMAISTHTLTWSVTGLATLSVAKLVNFNSHAHVERDVLEFNSKRYRKHFNSHAHVERDKIKSQV